MKRSSIILNLFLLIIGVWYLGSGCANIGSPTGGPRDTIPPNLVTMYPRVGTVNFKDKLIRLEFDEYVNLKDFQSQLIITPRTDNRYKTKVNKNVVELRFEEPLADSTTYTFNFRNGIVDLTEGNVAKDLYLAFSTGPYLDSLTISGRVEAELSDKPADAATVALYNARDTANVFKNKPVYFTKTDKEGNYQFRNLKRGNYILYAFNDKNNSLTLQTKNEAYGYWPDTLKLSSSVDSVNVSLFNANADKPSVSNARAVGNYYEITFNKPMLEYQLEVEGNTAVSSNFIEDRKKVRVYPFALQDSVKANLRATDSLQQQVQKTVYIKFMESKRGKAPFAVDILPKKGAQQTKNARTVLNFTKPVAGVKLDSVRFRYDSLHWENITAQDITWNEQRDRATITKTLTSPKQAEQKPDINMDAQALAKGGVSDKPVTATLEIQKGAFISVESDTLGNQDVTYKLGSESQTGTISGTVSIGAENFIVQLVKTGKLDVVAEQYNANKYAFRMVEPGEYLIRVIVDRNGNRRWDPGNIHQLEAPEQAYIFPQPITIKANWEIQNPEINL